MEVEILDLCKGKAGAILKQISVSKNVNIHIYILFYANIWYDIVSAYRKRKDKTFKKEALIKALVESKNMVSYDVAFGKIIAKTWKTSPCRKICWFDKKSWDQDVTILKITTRKGGGVSFLTKCQRYCSFRWILRVRCAILLGK